MQVTNCGLCHSFALYPILDLGRQPLAESHRSDARWYPLRLVQCADCDLVQLDYRPEEGDVFPKDHPYSSGNAKALHEHFQAFADEWTLGGALVVDIGCNDGTLLSKFNGCRKVGVEPTNQANKAREHADEVYQFFFTEDIAHRIVREHGQASLVTATNVLAHCPNPHDFLRGVRLLLAPGGQFVTENHDVYHVLNGQWDTVYHEHLRYYSPHTLEKLLIRNGFEVGLTQRIPTHGGSFRTYATVNRSLQDNADGAAALLRNILGGNKVHGIGATTRASGLIHFAGIADNIAAVCEVSTSDKLGLVMPGTEIPIVDEAVLFGDHQPGAALLFSWHLADSIVPKLREKGFRGDLIIPLPTPKVLKYEPVNV